MYNKLTSIVITALILTTGYITYWAGRNAEFEKMVNRVKKSENNEIYTFLSNGDYVKVSYHEGQEPA